MMPAKWSTCTAQDLLDKAQKALDEDRNAQQCMALLGAAQVQAIVTQTQAIRELDDAPGRWKR
jgi:hypothetical protein